MTTDNPLPRYTPVLVADPTPPLPHAAPAPAAVTGTGGEDDTRRLAWLATELAYDWTIGEIDIAELACAYASDAGREDEDPIADDVIAALRLAIDTMMSPGTPQEAQP